MLFRNILRKDTKEFRNPNIFSQIFLSQRLTALVIYIIAANYGSA